LILSNAVRAEAGFIELVRFILDETGVPFDWEYGDRAGKSVRVKATDAAILSAWRCEEP
jgi:hypothetical protein